MNKLKIITVILATVFLLILIALFFSFFNGFSFAPTVAVIKIEGQILSSNESFLPQKTVFDVIDELTAAEEDPLVSAIFLEVNSPGGSAVASKQLFEKIKNAKKPVVAWISDFGTSGAYYSIAGADLIIADEDSITGSIGVISIIGDYSGLMEKLGIKFNVLKEGKYKDIGSPFREMTEDENKIMQEILSQIYANFKENILSVREKKLNLAKFNELADGRILTGAQAKEIGLIDETGSREFALRRTAELIGFKGIPLTKSFEKKSNSLLDLIASAGFAFGQGFKLGLTNEKLTINT